MRASETKAPARPRLLLVDDDEDLRASLCKILEREGFETTGCATGKSAQEILGLESFDLLLTDVHIPGSQIGGLELLQFVRALPKPFPVILMTGFGTLSETREAHSMGAAGFLAKPFKREEILQVLRAALPAEPVPAKPAPAESLDSQYCKLNIDDFVSGKKIEHNVYVRLSAAKYVKVAHQGEDISVERIRAYKNKDIRHLYLEHADFLAYMRFNLGLTQAIKRVGQISRPKKLNLCKHAGELILEHLYSNELNAEAFADARSVVETTLDFLTEDPTTLDLLESLSSHSDYLYAHSLGVSLYSSLISKQVGWGSATTLYKISTAALLHDIGFKDIDRQLLTKPKHLLTAEEKVEFEKHCARGMEALSACAAVSSDILQVVFHHHERESGSGFPLALTRGHIHPLAQLVAVADEFCYLAIKGPHSPGLSPKEAGRRLQANCASSLDDRFMDAMLQVVGLKEVPA